MEGMEGLWRFAVIALLAVAAGAGVGILLGGANSDPFETVLRTVTGKRHTVTETETRTVTKTRTETVTRSERATEPLDGGAGADDDADGDGCSDSYAGPCVEPFDGYNHVDCAQIGDHDFSSIGDDPYGLDPDDDGVACESP
jgi:hypothetical protein